MLLPLVNVSMLEYTIEFLALNGVQEIFVVSARHPDTVREFISSCKSVCAFLFCRMRLLFRC